MRLWQKVFFCGLTITVLAVMITSLIIIQSDFQRTVFSSMENLRLENSFLASGILSEFTFQKNLSNQPFLDDKTVEEVLVQAAAEQTSGSSGMAVYKDGELLTSANTPMELRGGKLQQEAEKGSLTDDSCQVEIRRSGEKYYGIAVSLLTYEQSSYELYTVSDITNIYTARKEQLQRVQLLLLLFIFITGAIFFLVFRKLLSPLGKINAALHSISQGNYRLRVPETGSQEFRELSQNMNQMISAVEENTQRIQDLADSRKQFTDNLAHEMKTPLTSILGFADLLRVQRTVSDKQRRDFSGVIVEEARRLQNLSGKLMELAVANNAKPDYSLFPVHQLFQEISLSVSPLLAKREIRLLVQCKEEIAYGDRELIKSLLYNLVDNASKASKPGEEVLLACYPVSEGLILSVSDWGMGMDEATIRRATEPFYMADKSRSRKSGGAGLGLALCARIAEMHGKPLQFKSSPGEGTTVFLTLPDEAHSPNRKKSSKAKEKPQ